MSSSSPGCVVEGGQLKKTNKLSCCALQPRTDPQVTAKLTSIEEVDVTEASQITSEAISSAESSSNTVSASGTVNYGMITGGFSARTENADSNTESGTRLDGQGTNNQDP